ncbi:MAG: NUDIX domain-containing protein [Pirellulaceae bacterium]|nr:NUDIX domain-containing protein [Pirellulaceae bacterium]
MRQIKACGVLVVRGNPPESFLLMKHKDRWDLPKGHLDGDETEEECARRELLEETGIDAADMELLPGFRWATEYYVNSKRFGEKCHKTLVIFLGRLKRDVKIAPTEHLDFRWFPWQPPHRIQAQTIDPLLTEAERYFFPKQ